VDSLEIVVLGRFVKRHPGSDFACSILLLSVNVLLLLFLPIVYMHKVGLRIRNGK